MADKRTMHEPGGVLPITESRAGGQILRTIDDLLDDESKQLLRRDLDEIARLRAEAEASSAVLRFS